MNDYWELKFDLTIMYVGGIIALLILFAGTSLLITQSEKRIIAAIESHQCAACSGEADQ